LSKIYIFLPTLGYGGAEISLTRVAQYLSENTHFEIKLLVAKKLNNDLEVKLPETLQVKYLNSSRTFFSLFKLIKVINSEKPNAILTTLPTPNFMVTALKKLRLINSKIVLREANSNYANWGNSFKDKIKGKLAVFAFNNSDANIFISDELKLNIEKYISNKANSVIYNPVFTGDFFSKANELVEGLEFSDKEIWLTTSRLEHQKGLDLLFEAAYHFIDKRNFVLFVVGDGSLESHYRNKYSDLPINFIGNVDNSLKYLDKADIFFFPSRREGLGNSLIEAQILGKNIITSNCPSGPKEIVSLFSHGILFESENVDNLIECIENIELKEDGIVEEELINNFSVEKVSSQYFDLLKNLI